MPRDTDVIEEKLTAQTEIRLESQAESNHYVEACLAKNVKKAPLPVEVKPQEYSLEYLYSLVYKQVDNFLLSDKGKDFSYSHADDKKVLEEQAFKAFLNYTLTTGEYIYISRLKDPRESCYNLNDKDDSKFFNSAGKSLFIVVDYCVKHAVYVCREGVIHQIIKK